MHSQAASQGTGVVNDRNADVAMYWLSASTFTNIRSDDVREGSMLQRPDSLNGLPINLMDHIETVIYDEVICDDCFVPPCSKTRNCASYASYSKVCGMYGRAHAGMSHEQKSHKVIPTPLPFLLTGPSKCLSNGSKCLSNLHTCVCMLLRVCDLVGLPALLQHHARSARRMWPTPLLAT
jgi:hypothetical protein